MEKGSIIDIAFRKEIGIDINKAVYILDRGGIAPEELNEITNKLKKVVTDEVEIRDVPYEYRFLMLNVILCTMLKTTIEYYKNFVDAIKDIKETEEIETE